MQAWTDTKNKLPGTEISKAGFAFRLLGGSSAARGPTVIISWTFSGQEKIWSIKSNYQLSSCIRAKQFSLGPCCLYSTIIQVVPIFFSITGSSIAIWKRYLSCILFTSHEVVDKCDASGVLPIYSEFKMNMQECTRLCQGLKLYHRFYKSLLTNHNNICSLLISLNKSLRHCAFIQGHKGKQMKKDLIKGEKTKTDF